MKPRPPLVLVGQGYRPPLVSAVGSVVGFAGIERRSSLGAVDFLPAVVVAVPDRREPIAVVLASPEDVLRLAASLGGAGATVFGVDAMREAAATFDADKAATAASAQVCQQAGLPARVPRRVFTREDVEAAAAAIRAACPLEDAADVTALAVDALCALGDVVPAPEKGGAS